MSQYYGMVSDYVSNVVSVTFMAGDLKDGSAGMDHALFLQDGLGWICTLEVS